VKDMSPQDAREYCQRAAEVSNRQEPSPSQPAAESEIQARTDNLMGI
jgi:hypothetical protein